VRARRLPAGQFSGGVLTEYHLADIIVKRHWRIQYFRLFSFSL